MADELQYNKMKDHALRTWQIKRIYKMNGKEILSSSQERNMGILIKEDLDWDAHVTKVTNQANGILGMIRKSYEDKCQKYRAALQVPCKATFGICDTSLETLQTKTRGSN